MQKLYLHGHADEEVYRYLGLVPKEFIAAFRSRWDLIPYNMLTLFTSMFLHGGILHIGGNMLYLAIFGNNVEDAFGHMRFLFFYIVSGLIAATFQIFYDPGSAVPMIGASGAVAGVLGSYLVLFPLARVKTILFIVIFIKIVEIPAIILLTVWFIMQVLLSYGGEGVAWYAHIGGFIFGLVTARLLSTKKKRRRR
ncbi:MAG: rhomboid family intramembrane serine protease [Syntrophobacterales bacterium]|jgi:membrane associated rhomboid family serine protease|nr:rhomboid family intramembrane serine protease [Syntrophobacterales bacterium]